MFHISLVFGFPLHKVPLSVQNIALFGKISRLIPFFIRSFVPLKYELDLIINLKNDRYV